MGKVAKTWGFVGICGCMWLKVAKSGFMRLNVVFYVVKSGFMWLKIHEHIMI